MSAGPAAAEPSFPTVTINTTTTAGFVHPGVAVSADSLVNARAQVLAGTEPWASYHKAMVAPKYASTAFSSANQCTTPGTPAVNTFNSQSVEARFIDDAFRAYTQAIQYVITGNPAYRENALKIIRIWSQMGANGYAVYPDARIHSGTPLMRMTAAAEILRFSSVNPADDGYDLSSPTTAPPTPTFE
ncbi:MAG TPA: hypothetical protein VFP34_05585 [Microlunatus sp.]|nr:hypothetical protein [Microlunatus sp.]